jgi:hypothetical protein
LLKVDILQSPFGKLLLGPFLGRAHIGRAREPRAMHVGHKAYKLHDLRAFQALLFDLVYGVDVYFFLRGLRDCRHARKRDAHDEQEDRSVSPDHTLLLMGCFIEGLMQCLKVMYSRHKAAVTTFCA